ncbi:hypothetical protein LX99_00633 [Mucilaginibacter oryzae]|uniref:Uncharacterized protein n=1 Tax=Mucilaginibacter oryzae TaxID=468058 RepID=A0A316HG16_9SPHI|nr:hypothetical protein [Mucilaginibacter oryzae]PWK80169.1 hypothetical protein LX99_00633 [Mucilaginibacter oryzae]
MSQKYQLISGTFKASEALSIIMSFYNHKINYHNVQLLTAMERNDNNVAEIEQKVKELRNTGEMVRRDLTEGIAHDHQVEVKGFIELNLNPVTDGR